MDREDKLIKDNMGLVYKQLHKFNMVYDADAFSFAMEALMNAVKTYNDSLNTAFSTYATVCIYNALGCYLRRLNKKNQINTISYNEPLFEDSKYTLESTLSDKQNPETILIVKERHGALMQAFEDLLETMSPNARLVVEYWRASNFIASQLEIAKATGVTQSYVSRTLSAFRHKLKQKLEEW